MGSEARTGPDDTTGDSRLGLVTTGERRNEGVGQRDGLSVTDRRRMCVKRHGMK